MLSFLHWCPNITVVSTSWANERYCTFGHPAARPGTAKLKDRKLLTQDIRAGCRIRLLYPPSLETMKPADTHSLACALCANTLSSISALSLNSLFKIFPLGLFGTSDKNTTPPVNCL